MLNQLVFNGQPLEDFKVSLTNAGIYKMPDRDVSKQSVPGRNGDVVIDNGRYNNIEIEYPCVIHENFDVNFPAMMAYLLNQKGYGRLEDSFYPEYYRSGAFVSVSNKSVSKDGSIGTFSLTFNCKPQRWLKSGETKYTLEQSGSMKNPSAFGSKPFIRLYGKGTLIIAGQSLTIDPLYPNSYLDVDCELMNAYYGDRNFNNYVSGNFPELPAGLFQISWTGTSLEIIPKWWTI